ncbi:hypothetical protein CJ179_10395 [Rhodococcus sp. ACS1]|uniref:LPO_1073/Vpar_1526 family protein n=1 Tax=Rhodococcus sp. ACS1 TaxID=2028570 RepID=UPI000BB1633A|nr:LPO_1073/Vpar_1526 family protein [Rhodococcus sp. ACS1]PBC51159.1 hypothetical protein CJ179_10395 [Rhodococcus sp. ACS1]
MKDQQQQAGDHSTLVQGNSVELHQHGLTLEEVRQVASDVFRMNYLELTADAMKEARRLADEFAEMLLLRLEQADTHNVEQFRTPAMQSAVYSAQKAYVETADPQLAEALAELLLEKSATQNRSMKGIVLASAIETIPKLTTEQIAALCALVILVQTVRFNWETPKDVLLGLDEQLTPLYGKIPTTNSSYQYMGSVGVGSLGLGNEPYASLVSNYPGAFNLGYPEGQIPEPLTPFADGDLFRPAHDGSGRKCIAFGTDQNLRGRLAPQAQHLADDVKNALGQNRMETQHIEEITADLAPPLHKFLAQMKETSATQFQLTTLGIAIGHTHWKILAPDFAPELDIYLQ